MDAYLDIETTGLSHVSDRVTVLGLHLGGSGRVIQWVGENIAAHRVLRVLEQSEVTTIFTYNGKRFDLPFLRNQIGIDLEGRFEHRDLMHDCWRQNLYGGLKTVERRLGVPRRSVGVDGLEAIRLWNQFEQQGDRSALRRLLDYNREDVINLRAIKEIILRQ
ncbi:MAG: ribonuclease H-like domain-containing protein [Dehalococcoidia bacterium]|nr:ribonuclease H-like domain-containing protein [Dehalococcoidia bacterium]